MKLLEALAESNFKIYTNYECNYELILQILSYYNVIAEILFEKRKIFKININNNNKHSNFDAHTKLMHTQNFFSQQMLAHPLKLFPTNVAASYWNGEQWFFWKVKYDMMEKRGQILYRKG